MAFDPDSYLAEKTGNSNSFDPDAYLAQKTSQPQSSFFGNAGQDLKDIYNTTARMGQGIMDLPKDVYQTGKQLVGGDYLANTPIGKDMSTVTNAAYQMPKALLQQGVDLAAEPFKHIPGKIGDTMKQYYPNNPYYEHPVNSMLALAPLAKPLMGTIRSIPAVDEGLNAAQNSVRENLVAPNARRALGKFPMGTSTADANQVGLSAMDQGVIKNPLTNPLSSGREAMLGRATAINDSLGEHIGNFLKGQGEGLDADQAMAELDKVKKQFMNDPVISRKVDQAKNLIAKNSTGGSQDLQAAIQLRGKTYVGQPGEIHADVINQIADQTGESTDKVIDAVNKIGDQGFSQNGQFLTRDQVRQMTGSRPEAASLLAEGKMSNAVTPPAPNKMGFAEANKLKGLFQSKVNYMTDAATQNSGKAIAGNFRNSIDSQLDQLSAKLGNQEGMQNFQANKKAFGQTRQMQDVLEKQANRDSRNMPVSLPSVGVGIGGFIKGGGPSGALAALGAEWVKRYGNATAAAMMNDVSKAVGGFGQDTFVGNVAKAAPFLGQAKKTLDDAVVARYMAAHNNNPQEAATAAEADGYKW